MKIVCNKNSEYNKTFSLLWIQSDIPALFEETVMYIKQALTVLIGTVYAGNVRTTLFNDAI